MSIEVIKSGLLTTVQDLGRFGYQKYGVGPGGAMDPFAHRVANLLVGNSQGESTLEITWQGPVLSFREDALIALCGGRFLPIPGWRPVYVRKGTVIDFGISMAGCRAYLAVAEGFVLPVVMGSRSTHLRAGIGGFKGRALQAGDVLPLRATPSELMRRMRERKGLPIVDGRSWVSAGKWRISPLIGPAAYQRNAEVHLIRVIRGRQFALFSEESRERFFSDHYTITPQADRMGYRLRGAGGMEGLGGSYGTPEPQLVLSQPYELISEPVTFGTIQVPADGQPVILMADRQTTGGYPQIAQVAAVDLPILAQRIPGDQIRFTEISLRDAESLYVQQEKELRMLGHILKSVHDR